jgi:hypothetical protein
MRACAVIKPFLERQVRHRLRLWRRETDSYLADLSFKIQQRKMTLQKHKVLSLITLKTANATLLLKSLSNAFNHWKVETMLEKRILDGR